MNITSTQQDKMEMVLTQMGAKIHTIHGLLCYVKIMIKDTEVIYVYNVNSKNEYFLQRILPYPLGAGTFTTQKEVLKFIKSDIEQFKNASKKELFKTYIDINFKTHRLSHELEDLFFNYNVTSDKMESIVQLINETKKTIEDIISSSEKI